MPAAAVIPAPIAYIEVVAVKRGQVWFNNHQSKDCWRRRGGHPLSSDLTASDWQPGRDMGAK